MAENSSIGWCDHTANFWWGCLKVHRGCKNCYADDLDRRWTRKGRHRHFGPAPRTKRRMILGEWGKPEKWNREAFGTLGRRARVFCSSMCDVFEDYPGNVPVVDQLDAPVRVSKVMVRVLTEKYPDFEQMPTLGADVLWNIPALRWRLLSMMDEFVNLEFLLLTKRPENVRKMVPPGWLTNWPKHVMTGTSPCDQATAEECVPHLLGVPGRHFLSIEPLVGPVDMGTWLPDKLESSWCSECERARDDCLVTYDGHIPVSATCWACLNKTGRGIHWVIAGGESGPQAGPTQLEHLEQIVARVTSVKVPMFVKQIGSRPFHGGKAHPITDSKGERPEDWTPCLRVQQFPEMQECS